MSHTVTSHANINFMYLHRVEGTKKCTHHQPVDTLYLYIWNYYELEQKDQINLLNKCENAENL